MLRSIRLRVLVADDDLAVRTAVCRGLRRHFDVEEVGDGAQVLACIQAGKSFDAILMDVEMPVMDGRRALEALAVMSPALAERTIIVTGGASTPELQRWIEGLAPGRVHSKPVAVAVLIATIEGLAR